ncbi:hypothetical protein B0H10DRAFT_1953667 [Mycena sp. CBHHK59/15]|nr:hypothetical protein B0H10DRAFT_1953667 [Mycena sp. CBHHK59/15]
MPVTHATSKGYAGKGEKDTYLAPVRQSNSLSSCHKSASRQPACVRNIWGVEELLTKIPRVYSEKSTYHCCMSGAIGYGKVGDGPSHGRPVVSPSSGRVTVMVARIANKPYFSPGSCSNAVKTGEKIYSSPKIVAVTVPKPAVASPPAVKACHGAWGIASLQARTVRNKLPHHVPNKSMTFMSFAAYLLGGTSSRFSGSPNQTIGSGSVFRKKGPKPELD